ncbi:hypothetical protein [Caldisphaera sp.]|uniref:hypothetical protein n=1 Tax=Caldisphaera sp. TaxID=2060322 RepID=UPI0025B8BF5D|nr:hypothetical protein [Caldisphaera sp.]
MVDIYPVVQSSPPIVSTITTNVVINANSTYNIQVQELSQYLTNILFFQALGPTGTIYVYQYFSPDGKNYDTTPQTTITVNMTSTIFNYSHVFLAPTPYVQYGINPTTTITINFLGVVYR